MDANQVLSINITSNDWYKKRTTELLIHDLEEFPKTKQGYMYYVYTWHTYLSFSYNTQLETTI